MPQDSIKAHHLPDMFLYYYEWSQCSLFYNPGIESIQGIEEKVVECFLFVQLVLHFQISFVSMFQC